MTQSQKTNKMVMAALMMCLILIATMFFRIPIPFANGYVHLGDAFVFLSVLVLGKRYGIAAAAVGSALADVIGGFAIWAPWTFFIKALMALILAFCMESAARRQARRYTHEGSGEMLPAADRAFHPSLSTLIGMILAGMVEVAGYYAAEGLIYGNWLVPAAGVPWNVGQFVLGGIIAFAVAAALCRTPAHRYFTYCLCR